VITPHRRLSLGPVTPLRSFLEQVHWLSLDELGQQENLDAAIDLLTLPVRPEPELGPVVLSLLFERFPLLSREEILMIVGLPLQELRHTRAVQEILEEGRLEGRLEGREEGLEAGRQQEAAALAICQLSRHLEMGYVSPLDGVAYTSRIIALFSSIQSTLLAGFVAFGCVTTR
jgi:predicted transposase YdaD